MIATGVMIIGLCGTCTAFFDGNIIRGLLTPTTAYNDEAGIGWFALFVSVFVGGLPILIGALLLRSGLRRYRAAGPKPPPSVPPPG
jgi:hypothetical protein